MKSNFQLLQSQTLEKNGYVFASSKCFWQIGDEHTLSVSNVKLSLSSLNGKFKAGTNLNDAIKLVKGLYFVAMTEEPREYSCNCPMFRHYSECSHIVAAMTLEDEFDLANRISKFVTGKQRGRPANYIPQGQAGHGVRKLDPENEITRDMAANIVRETIAKEYNGVVYIGNVIAFGKRAAEGFTFDVAFPIQQDIIAEVYETLTYREIVIGKNLYNHYRKGVDESNKLMCKTCFRTGHLYSDCPHNLFLL